MPGERTASPTATERIAETRSPGRDVLEQETAGARPERGEDVLVEIEGGEDEDPGIAPRRGDAPGRLDPVHRGHPHVHQHDVGRELGRQGDRGGAVAGLADDLQVLLRVEDHAEAEADQLLVVGQQYPDAHTGSRPPGTVSARPNPPAAVGGRPGLDLAAVDGGPLAHAAETRAGAPGEGAEVSAVRRCR